MLPIAPNSLKAALFRYQPPARGAATFMTVPSKAALRAELEAALANYRGPVKQCPAAPPLELVFEEELEALDVEDEADEEVVPGVR